MDDLSGKNEIYKELLTFAAQKNMSMNDLFELMLEMGGIETPKQYAQPFIPGELEYRLLVEYTSDMISIHSLTGLFLYASPASRMLMGVEPEELTGRSAYDFFHPEDLEEILKSHTSILEYPDFYTVVYRMRLKDGSYKWVETTSRTVRNENAIQYIIATTRDINKRKQAEHALHQSEQKFATVFEFNPDAILIRSAVSGKIIAVNHALIQMTGYTADELIGSGYDEINVWANDDEFKTFLNHLEQNLEIRDFEGTFRRKNGDTLIGLVSTSLIEIDGERCILTMTRDVTAYRSLEQQKWEFELQKEKLHLLKHFLGDASHDLHTPLSTLKTAVYILKKTEDTHKMRQQIGVLQSQVEKLEGLLDDMFTMLRLDTEQDFSFETHDINGLIRQLLSKDSQIADGKQQQVVFRPQEVILPIRMEQAYLERALNNIVLNALHYTPEHGKITVQTYVEPSCAIVEIQDTGSGIASPDLPHIFDPFYRGDKARNSASGGTGLGLTIAQKVIALHNGKIEAKSRVGEGSLFRVVLPLHS